jgi:actin-related protein
MQNSWTTRERGMAVTTENLASFYPPIRRTAQDLLANVNIVGSVWSYPDLTDTLLSEVNSFTEVIHDEIDSC